MKAVAIVAAALALAPTAGAAPLTVKASFSDRTVLFGAPTEAVVTVSVDTRLVDPDTVRLEADLVPLRTVGPVSTERQEAEDLVVLTRRSRVACVTDACLPDGEARRIALPPVLATGRGTGGRSFVARTRWPTLLVAPRVPQEATAGEPVWRVDTSPPATTYRVSPSLLTASLWVAAAVLALVAVALVGREVALRRGRRVRERRSELELALAAVRASADRDAAERRRAVGVLARLLRRRADDRSTRVAALAWDEPAPEPERVLTLADEVEREVRA